MKTSDGWQTLRKVTPTRDRFAVTVATGRFDPGTHRLRLWVPRDSQRRFANVVEPPARRAHLRQVRDPLMLLGAPTAYWATVAGMVGLALGSFATVVASRWPAGGSLVTPRSHCTGCARTLGPLELVPVLSWVALRGPLPRLRRRRLVALPGHRARERRCSRRARSSASARRGRACRPRSWASPWCRWSSSTSSTSLIPDIIVLPAAGALPGRGHRRRPPRMVGARSRLPSARPASSSSSGSSTPAAWGSGDVKLALLLGAVLGASVVPALLVAFAGGAALGVVLLARFGVRARKMAVPFGPFLAAGRARGALVRSLDDRLVRRNPRLTAMLPPLPSPTRTS